MVFKRRYKRRRKFWKPRRTKKTRAQKLANDSAAAPVTANSVYSAAWKALKIANQVRKVINVEKKYIDTPISDDSIINVRDIFLLNAMDKGDDHDQREGDSMLMQTLHVKANIFANTTPDTTTFKIAYILDKESKGVLPTATDIWDDNSLAGYELLEHRNRDYSDRFVVLKEWTITLNNTDKNGHYFEDFIKLGVHTKYFKDSNVGTIADISDNALYMVINTNQTSNGGIIRATARLTYTDN